MARFLLTISRFYTSTRSLPVNPCSMFQTFSSSNSILNKNPGLFLSRQSLGYRYLSNFSGMDKENSNKRRKWILGIVVAIFLPFATNKWGPLLIFKNEVDTAMETIEQITEVVEKTAEVVDKVAENIADHLPEGGKFRKTVDFIENVAETTAKDAHLVEDIIDKVQGVEEDVESIVESLNGEADKPSREIKDKK
ncbi:uncharacterized protein LOC111408726 isoform X2 [Olea europaea var. sylvestris]|uniref:Uncharacterized protein n=1 Tax=Olea europaea subsp. europaea TaxID=158383 RepID=A0A8S0PQR9_OLEEU|nr:uncharacterized protein LOC111408726 isoform X2 [Olea europaea var. sylvestris]CAA2956797.1 Hypothetical predicted protein [Olea europaea subsp. europaea]